MDWLNSNWGTPVANAGSSTQNWGMPIESFGNSESDGCKIILKYSSSNCESIERINYNSKITNNRDPR